MWSAPRGNPASARIPGGSCRTTPRRSSSGTRRRRAAWARNAPCPPRTPSKSAADAGHGHADHTPGSGHDPLRTSRSRGWAECRPGTGCGWMGGMSIPGLVPHGSASRAAPTLPPHGHCSARSLEGLVGNWDRSDGLPPVLRPRLASGLLRDPVSACPWRRVRLGACQRAVIPRARVELGNPGVPFLQLTLEIRVLHVQSTQLALKPFTRYAQFATDCLQDLNMYCRIAGAAAFVQPLPQRQR